jgi:hypothetical protein
MSNPRYIDLNNIWSVIGDDQVMREQFEDYLRQNPSAEERAWQDREAQRDDDRARDQQEWSVK